MRNYLVIPFFLSCSASVQALTLEQSIAQAMMNNPQLIQKYAHFEAKYKDKRAAFSDYLPQVSLYAATGYEKITNNNGLSYDSELNRRELGLRVTQSLFSGFETVDEVARLDYEIKADQQALISAAENLSLEIAQVYIDLFQTQGVIELSEQNVKEHQEILTNIQKRENKGLSSAADVAQVQSRLATAQSSLLAAKNNSFDLKAQYFDLVGEYPIDLHNPQADSNYLPSSLNIAIDRAKENHPEIKASIFDVQAAEKQMDRDKSGFWPKVDLELDINSNDNIGGFEGPDDDGRIMLTMSYDIYSGGRTKAKTEASAWRKEEAKAIRDNTYRQVIEGTTLAWNAYHFVGEQKGFYRQNVDFATQTEKGYMQQFVLGRRSLLDVLDSKIELFNARKNYLKASFDEKKARYRLINATGKLIEELRVDTPDAWQLKDEDKQEQDHDETSANAQEVNK
ncbi:TolC family outer membrane protein [Colwellia sp. E2M01]|uniref:TolC family outer membrane protein n=1 Tax=Colwellia sp. E2M01 TaxID=2841561 RepID=UPI001C098349|nr:TolC family outer membrane protein [Colwellia sp. E2M01]MBU2871317.1 TolC family outer membrane protein [Colwellia sp. E2M01]